MCSYIGFKTNVKDLLVVSQSGELSKLLDDILFEKGGDESYIILYINGFIKKFKYEKGMNLKIKLSSILDYVKSPYEVYLLAFSRMTPEMEIETKNKTSSQPYIINNEYNEYNDSIIMVHGTIPKAEDMEKFFTPKDSSISIEIDTDIFKKFEIRDCIEYIEQVGGKVSALFLINNEFSWYSNGLGIYKFSLDIMHQLEKININNIYTNVKKYPNTIELDGFKYYENQPIIAKKVAVLFSGGLDITASVYEYLDKHKPEKIELIYFNWGTRAAIGEISAGKKFQKLLSDLYPKITIEYVVKDIQSFFNNILNCCGLQTTRLVDKNAKPGGKEEAEAAISYVPFRNQFLLTLVSAYLEQKYPQERIDIIVGLNLSEGMIYTDNSYNFLDKINDVIKVGGQNSYKFNIVAPFVNKTKTHLVKIAKEKKYDLSTVFSCYFPMDDGTECGTCGSCLLKNTALFRNN